MIPQPVVAMPLSHRPVQSPRPNIAVSLCIVLLGLYALFFVVRAMACLIFPYTVEYGEGAVLYDATRLARGMPLYDFNTAPDYTAAVYSPFYYMLVALPVKLGGAGFAYGRLISIVATFAVMWLIYCAACSVGINRIFAIAPALGVLALPPVYQWGTIHKTDMLAIALSIGAVVVVGRRQSGDNRWHLLPCVLLCVGAVFTKQSALAAPLAIILWLGLREWRAAMWFGGLFLAGAGLLAALSQIITAGAFFTHVFVYNGQRIVPAYVLIGLLYFVTTYPILVVLAALSVWRVGRAKALRTDIMGLWTLYGSIAFVLSLGVGKIGANINYYIEPLIAATLLAWWWLAQKRARRSALVVTGAMALQLLLVHHLPFVADGANTPTSEEATRATHIATIVHEYAARGPVLAEESGWLAAQELPTELDDSFVFAQLAHDGAWDETRFVDNLRAGHYVLIIVDDPDSIKAMPRTAGSVALHADRFTPPMAAAIAARYHIVDRAGATLLLVPNAP